MSAGVLDILENNRISLFRNLGLLLISTSHQFDKMRTIYTTTYSCMLINAEKRYL